MKISGTIINREAGQKVLPEIDGLRFLAILLVIFSHVLMSIVKTLPRFDYSTMRKENFLFYLMSKGPVGVLIFFCLSGFIIALPFAKQTFESLPLKDFYFRRLKRISPPYWIALGVVFILNAWFQVQEFQGLGHFFASIFYCHNLVFGNWSNVLPVAWSLEIEIQFYLLAPFILWIYFKSAIQYRRLVFFALMFIAPFLQIGIDLQAFHLHQSFLNFFQYFFAGILCADLYQHPPQLSQSLALLTFMMGIVLILVCLKGGFYQKLGMPFAILMLVFGVLKHEGVRKFFSINWMSKVGVFSYSIYLIHYPLIYLLSLQLAFLFSTTGFETTFLIQALIGLPIVYLFGVLFFVLIEKPFMAKSGPVKYFIKLKNA
jgi:peptidoglycan/LPS O-acetylase OafA/YrhL